MVFHLPPLAHIPQQRGDMRRLGAARIGKVRVDLNPNRLVVGPPQPEQVVGHGAVAHQSFDEPAPRLGVDEPIVVERADLTVIGLRREPEHQLQVRVGAESRSFAVVRERAEVDAFVGSLEESDQRGAQIERACVPCDAGRHG